MFDLQFIWKLFATVGIGSGAVILAAYAFQVVLRVWANRAHAHTRQMNTSTQQEEIINSLILKFDMDIRAMREQHGGEIREVRDKYDSVLDKFHETDKELAREQGRRETMQEQMDTDRRERNELKDEIQKQSQRILELEKHQQQSKARISELEAQIELLNKQLAEANKENSVLQAQKRELEKLLELEKQRAESLSNRITQYQAEAQAAAPPGTPDVDDTIYPLPPKNAEESAEEQLP